MNFRTLLFCFFCFGSFSGIAQKAPYVFVFLNSNPDKKELPKEEVDKLMEGHMANINRLANEGKLLVAGPFNNGGGIFIFNSTSIAEVTEWLSTDPGVRANRWNIETLHYSPRHGGICVVDTSAQMVQYRFIRYTSNITKFNVQQGPKTFKAHDDYLKQIVATGNVITEGIFDNDDGGILIMQGELNKEVIQNDPAVKEQFLLVEFKDLWVGKGSFCEH